MTPWPSWRGNFDDSITTKGAGTGSGVVPRYIRMEEEEKEKKRGKKMGERTWFQGWAPPLSGFSSRARRGGSSA